MAGPSIIRCISLADADNDCNHFSLCCLLPVCHSLADTVVLKMLERQLLEKIHNAFALAQPGMRSGKRNKDEQLKSD